MRFTVTRIISAIDDAQAEENRKIGGFSTAGSMKKVFFVKVGVKRSGVEIEEREFDVIGYDNLPHQLYRKSFTLKGVDGILDTNLEIADLNKAWANYVLGDVEGKIWCGSKTLKKAKELIVKELDKLYADNIKQIPHKIVWERNRKEYLENKHICYA